MIHSYSVARAFAAALGTLLFASPPAAFGQLKATTDEPKKPAEAPKRILEFSQLSRSDEHMLLVRLLDYLHRDTFPPGSEREEDEQLPSSGQLKTFIEGRRKLTSAIDMRLRQIKASPDLQSMYDDYRSILDMADKYADAVRKHELEYYKGMKLIRDRAMTDIQVRTLIGNANVIQANAAVYSGVGRWAWWDPYANRHGLLAGAVLSGANLVSAQLRLHAAVLKILQREREATDRYEKKNLPILYNNIRSEESKFNQQIDSKRPELLKKDKGYFASLSKEYQWKEYEVKFDPFADDTMGDPKNPFLPLSKLNRAVKIQNTRHSDDLAAAAKSLLALTEFMPNGSKDDGTLVYSRIKADTAFLAGMHANRAAEFQLGDAGFRSCVKVPLEAGETARKAFALYRSLYVGDDEMYPKPIALQQEALALAYAGVPQAAYDKINLILKPDLKSVQDPQFYYDSARLRCLNNKDNSNVPVAMAYLNSAFMMGYRNTEKARVSTDLKILRDVHKVEFENVINVFK